MQSFFAFTHATTLKMKYMNKLAVTAFAGSAIAFGAVGLVLPNAAIGASVAAIHASVEQAAPSVNIPSLSLRVGEQKAVTATFANLDGERYRKIKMPLGLKVIATSTPGMTVFPDANNVSGYPGGNTVEFVVEAVADAPSNTATVSVGGGKVIGNWEAGVTSNFMPPYSARLHSIDETDGTVTIYGTGTYFVHPSSGLPHSMRSMFLDGNQAFLFADDFFIPPGVSGWDSVVSWHATFAYIAPGPHTLRYQDDKGNTVELPFEMGAGSPARDVTLQLGSIDRASGRAIFSGTGSPGEQLTLLGQSYSEYGDITFQDSVKIKVDDTGTWTSTIALNRNDETQFKVYSADERQYWYRQATLSVPKSWTDQVQSAKPSP